MPDKVLLKLSDAFESPADGFEWTATVLNVNVGHNKTLLEACKSLHDYATYVKLVRDNLSRGMKTLDAVNTAVDEAIRLGLLEDFFKVHKAEVFMNILTEFDQEKYDRCRRREGYEDGKRDGAVETAKNLLLEGIPVGTIAKCTGLLLEDVEKLRSSTCDCTM